MNVLLICPAEQKALPLLSSNKPAAAVGLMGQSLLEYWLAHLARLKATQVLVTANDRPEVIKDLVDDGSRWGLKAEVIAESRELTTAEALIKYGSNWDPSPARSVIAVLDHFPTFPDQRLFAAPADFLNALVKWMPNALTPDRVGMSEVSSGVWVGAHSNISPKAQLKAPCWIGQHAIVGAGAIVGPEAIVEDGACIEGFAEVSSCWIGERTYVGELTHIHDALAWGNTLVHRQTGVTTIVPDRFVLSTIGSRRDSRKAGLFSRLRARRRRNRESMPLLLKGLMPNNGG